MVHSGFNNRHTNETTLPCRYMKALKKYNKSVHIFPSNKSSGIIIMDIHVCQQKMKLQDDNIYEKVNRQKVIKETQRFKHKTRKLLKKEDSSWLKLIEYHPLLYRLPKLHKPGILMKPIISGLGISPYTYIYMSYFGITNLW